MPRIQLDTIYRPRKSGGGKARRAKAPGPVTDFPLEKTTDEAAPPIGNEVQSVEPSQPKFNRTEYQRLYMKDRTQAKKMGIPVSEYRKLQETK